MSSFTYFKQSSFLSILLFVFLCGCAQSQNEKENVRQDSAKVFKIEEQTVPNVDESKVDKVSKGKPIYSTHYLLNQSSGDTLAVFNLPPACGNEESKIMISLLEGQKYFCSFGEEIEAELKFVVYPNDRSLEKYANDIETSFQYSKEGKKMKPVTTSHGVKGYFIDQKWMLKRDLKTFKRGEIYELTYIFELDEAFMRVDFSYHERGMHFLESTKRYLLESLRNF